MSSGDQEIDYFFAALNYYLGNSEPSSKALINATNDYRFVFMPDPGDDRLPLARAASIALKHLHSQEDNDMPQRNEMTVEELLGTMTDEQRHQLLSDKKRETEKEMQPLSEPEKPKKPILVLDFDGVLNSYTSGWQGATVISDPPVPNAQNFCAAALADFEIWIVSSRCSHPGGSDAIGRWLYKWRFPEGIHISENGAKPAAFITIDDRAITFNGLWPNPSDLLKFKPWYQRRIEPKDNQSSSG